MMARLSTLFFIIFLAMLWPDIQAAAASAASSTSASSAAPIHNVDSLLSVYEKARKSEKVVLGRQIISLCLAGDQLFHIDRQPDKEMPVDTLNLLVWMAGERYYTLNSYFKESLSLIDKALPLSSENNPEYHATLLCDRGYCLFKTSRNKEAAEAELEAERVSKRHGLLLPLARSYNYLAIINVSLGYLDEAKHFVQKALDTDRLTGSNLNTHNYLGIACEVYNVAKEPDLAIRYGHQAVDAARAIGYEAGVVNHLSQLSYAYNRKGDLQQALAMSQEAVRTVEAMEVVDRNLLAISLEYVAFNLLDMKRNSEAVPYIRRAIALQEELGNYRSVCYDHLSLAEALEVDEPLESNKAVRRYAKMLDSLHNAEMHEALSNANAALHNEELQEANEEGKRRERLIAIVSVAGILLLLGVIAVLSYINRLRKRTQQATKRLQADREAFYTNVTHEVRTPLTVVLGMTRRLRSAEPDAAKRDALAIIERNGQSLLTLINQLLNISKLSSDNYQFSWQDGDVSAFVEIIAERFRPLAAMNGVDLVYQSPSSPIKTFFVSDAMQKMVGNLLSNAIKFTPRGGTVTLSVGSDANHYLVRVADTGIGIQPEDIAHLFEPFYQGANHMRTGTGVGLSLVSQLAKALDGQVDVSSTPGVKTVFAIRLPLKERLSAGDRLVTAPVLSDDWDSPSLIPVQASGPTGQVLRNGPESATESPAGDDGRTRILVVEDNADVSAFIGCVLGESYAVAYASDGAEGVQKATEWMPDLIVTDVMMPEVDGLELCRRIRSSEKTNHIPIIIITARTTDSDRLSGFEAGAEAYLCKPFLSEELLLRVSKLLEQRRLLQKKFQRSLAGLYNSEAAAHGEPEKRMEGRLVPATKEEEGDSPSAQAPTIYERNLSEANSAFLRKVDEAILRLMPEGKLDVQDVASAVFLSRSQFGRKLRAVVDMSPSDYISDVRLNEVKRLLHEQPPLPLLEIALLTGFADHAHLSHAFRRKFGMSPSQYLKSENAS